MGFILAFGDDTTGREFWALGQEELGRISGDDFGTLGPADCLGHGSPLGRKMVIDGTGYTFF